MLQFNKENLRKVFHDFYVLTHLRIVLIDSEFNELLSYPEKQYGFCAEIRRNMDVHYKCLASDKAGCLACANSKELNIYRCHMGLVEAVIPILDGGEILGYVMFGQILKSDTCDIERRRLKRTFANWPYSSIDSVVDEIPTRSEEELNAAATILQALTTYVLFNRWVAPKKYDFIRRLDTYIQEHLRGPITVDDICLSFGIARTRLYSIATDYLGCGIAEYIRKKRIFHAKEFLEKTELPISQIVYDTGFCDYSHFSRVFKEETGVTAREYRKSHHS